MGNKFDFHSTRIHSSKGTAKRTNKSNFFRPLFELFPLDRPSHSEVLLDTMTSARGPDWDFYQCKCGNIVFEYNTITGEKCLSETWKECTVNCMEPVSHVPPSARPFTTISIPVSRPRKHMATQTNEDISTKSVMTQTRSTNCPCNEHSTVLVASSDVNHGSLDKEKSQSFCEDCEEKDGVNEECETRESKQKDKKSKANEKAKVPNPSNGGDRVLRKRKTDRPDGKGLGQAEVKTKTKKPKQKA